MSYQVIFTDTLYHHGIKGQRWGIRRFRKRDGTLTNAGKRRYDNENSKKPKKKSYHRVTLEMRYMNAGMSKEEAEQAADKKIKIEKGVAIGVGITGAVALGAYVVHKNRQYIRNKASKRQIEIGKKKVSNIVDLDIQSRTNYVDAKNSKDIKGMIKEKKRMKTYRKAAKKITDTYSREAYKLKTGKYKDAKNFLLENHKPYDYLEDFATGGVIGAVGGTTIARKINKKKRR